MGGLSHLCVGISAPSLAMEENKPYAFHSQGVGTPLRSLVAGEYLSKKQDVGSVFIKTVSHLMRTCPVPCIVPENSECSRLTDILT